MNLTSRLEAALLKKQFSLLHLLADEATRRKLTLYAVGGLPRDLLLQRPTHDIDLVLEDDAIPFARALARLHGGRVTVHPTFHTATWFLPPHLTSPASTPFVDLISARSETYAHPAALPTVKLGTITEDLHRRDFTINAMAIRLDGPHFGKLITPFDGDDDLKRGLLRVLHPRSFIDDPTRIFRAVRYAGRYNFKVASGTQALIPGALKHINKLSPERLRHEFDLILEEDNAAAMLSRLADWELLDAVKPAMPAFDPAYARWLGHLPAVDLGLVADARTLGYLLWLMDTPDLVISALAERLDLTSLLAKSLRATARLKRDLADARFSKPSQWTERLDQVPPLGVYAVYLVTRHKPLKEYLVQWRHVHASITGDDLKARGLPPGPEYKRILSALRTAWLDGEVSTKAEEKKLLEVLLK